MNSFPNQKVKLANCQIARYQIFLFVQILKPAFWSFFNNYLKREQNKDKLKEVKIFCFFFFTGIRSGCFLRIFSPSARRFSNEFSSLYCHFIFLKIFAENYNFSLINRRNKIWQEFFSDKLQVYFPFMQSHAWSIAIFLFRQLLQWRQKTQSNKTWITLLVCVSQRKPDLTNHVNFVFSKHFYYEFYFNKQKISITVKGYTFDARKVKNLTRNVPKLNHTVISGRISFLPIIICASSLLGVGVSVGSTLCLPSSFESCWVSYGAYCRLNYNDKRVVSVT